MAYGRLRYIGLALLLTLLLLSGMVAPLAAREPAPEDAVKAAMLYNFMQFVHWPEGAAPQAGQPLVLGFLGRDALQEWLHDLAAGSHAESMRTLQIDSLQELRARKDALHVLYISRTAQEDIEAILRVLKGTPVLTVCDDELFVKQGGVMNFVRQNNRIRFDINLDAAAAGGLQISSRLSGLARRIVKDGVVGEGR